jgi:hypothetical protein
MHSSRRIRALECLSITLGRVTRIVQRMAAYFELGKFRGLGKKGVTGYLKLVSAITS